MKRILITGVNGFIGNKVGLACINQEDMVYGLDLQTNSSLKLENYFCKDMVHDDLSEILNQCRPDVIVHCAGSADVHLSISNPYDDFDRNVKATNNLFNSMIIAGIRNCRVILMSSAAVYGNPYKLPIHEKDQLNPISPYALHKELVENIGLYFKQQYGYDIKILRVFSAYGPGLKKQLFWDMYQKAKKTGEINLYGTGRESRDYIYIDDLIRVIILMIYEEVLDFDIYNVANGKEITILEVAYTFANILGISRDSVHFNQEVREGDPLNWRASVMRIKKMGYQQQVSLEKGIRNYITWCQKSDT